MSVKLSSAYIASEDQMKSTLYGTTTTFIPHKAIENAGTFSDVYTNGRPFNWLILSTSTNDGDSFTTGSFYLDKGTYSLDMYHGTNTNFGICDVYLDSTKIATIDEYAGSSGSIKTTTNSITVSTSGIKTMTFTANGKNASSSDYTINVCAVTFRKTA